MRRRRRPQDTVQILVFVGGPLLETVAPYGIRGQFYSVSSVEITLVAPASALVFMVEDAIMGGLANAS